MVRQELAHARGRRLLPIEIRHADEVITMEDSAAKAVRTKKNSSIHVAARLVRDGEAHGFVSAGNTGAVMATAKMVQGMIRGVQRPALASAFRRSKELLSWSSMWARTSIPSAEMLAQFAVMGEIYSRIIFSIQRRAWGCSRSAKKSTKATI